MRVSTLAFVVALTPTMTFGCSKPPRSTNAWSLKFGPVVSNELVVGRVIAGPLARIMTGADALVTVDLDRGTFSRSVVHPLAVDEHPWGLAAEGDRLWTLLSRTVLAQIQPDGLVVQRITLAEPHVGVFGTGAGLVYQLMNFQPPADALFTGPPGEAGRRVWGHMRTRALTLARTAVAALNLVSCGPTANGTVPCWFPDEPAVTLTSPAGASRQLALDGLPTVSPEVLLASDNPQRPVRDSFVAANGDLWVLGSGHGAEPSDLERRGGWLLAQDHQNGRLVRRTRLREPARLILAVGTGGGQACLLLAWDGHIVEVQP